MTHIAACQPNHHTSPSNSFFSLPSLPPTPPLEHSCDLHNLLGTICMPGHCIIDYHVLYHSFSSLSYHKSLLPPTWPHQLIYDNREVIVSKVWMSTDARLLLTSYWKNISSLGGITVRSPLPVQSLPPTPFLMITLHHHNYIACTTYHDFGW